MVCCTALFYIVVSPGMLSFVMLCTAPGAAVSSFPSESDFALICESLESKARAHGTRRARYPVI